jgi:hypothetical protein
MFRSTQQLIGKFGMDLGQQILHQVLIVLSSGSLLTVRASDILTVSGAVSISIQNNYVVP